MGRNEKGEGGTLQGQRWEGLWGKHKGLATAAAGRRQLQTGRGVRRGMRNRRGRGWGRGRGRGRKGSRPIAEHGAAVLGSGSAAGAQVP